MSASVKFGLILLAVAILVVAPFLFFGDQIEQLFVGDGAVERLRSYGSFAWLVAIGLLVSDVALPVPTTAVMAALGMIYGPILGGLIAALGSVVSGLVGYVLCRFMGRPVAIWLSGNRGLAKGEAVFAKTGGWFVALSRWLPIIAEVVACAAGLAKMQFSVFLAALICGSIPLGLAYATLGYLGTDRPILTLVLAAVLPFILWFLVRPLLQRRK